MNNVYPQNMPPSSAPYGDGGAKPSGNGLWWALAGLAVLVSAALLVWFLVFKEPSTQPSSVDSPSAPTSTSPSASDAPSSADPVMPDEMSEEWGEFPPTYLDSLKDLSSGTYPGNVGSYTLYQSEGNGALCDRPLQG